MTIVCHIKHADLQAASDGGAYDPTSLQMIDDKLPEIESMLSQVMAVLTTFIKTAGGELPPPPLSTVS